jgi:hypothetical protein
VFNLPCLNKYDTESTEFHFSNTLAFITEWQMLLSFQQCYFVHDERGARYIKYDTKTSHHLVRIIKISFSLARNGDDTRYTCIKYIIHKMYTNTDINSSSEL